MKFENKKMKYKCSNCGKEFLHIAEIFEHTSYDNDFGCNGVILTPGTIDEWNTYRNSRSEKEYNKRFKKLKEQIRYGFLELKETNNGLDIIEISESEWYGKRTLTTHIPSMTKEKYIKLHCQGVSDFEM